MPFRFALLTATMLAATPLAPALARTSPIRRAHHQRSLRTGVAAVLLCSGPVWLWRFQAGGVAAFVGANSWAWWAVWLLVVLPEPGPVPYGAPGRLD